MKEFFNGCFVWSFPTTSPLRGTPPSRRRRVWQAEDMYFNERASPQPLFNFLLQRKLLRAYHGAVGEDVNLVGACVQVFFHVPIDGHVLFLSVVFDVFLDGVG